MTGKMVREDDFLCLSKIDEGNRGGTNEASLLRPFEACELHAAPHVTVEGGARHARDRIHPPHATISPVPVSWRPTGAAPPVCERTTTHDRQ